MTARPAWLDEASSEVADDAALWVPEVEHLITYGTSAAEACARVGLSMSKVEKWLREHAPGSALYVIVSTARNASRKAAEAVAAVDTRQAVAS